MLERGVGTVDYGIGAVVYAVVDGVGAIRLAARHREEEVLLRPDDAPWVGASASVSVPTLISHNVFIN